VVERVFRMMAGSDKDRVGFVLFAGLYTAVALPGRTWPWPRAVFHALDLDGDGRATRADVARWLACGGNCDGAADIAAKAESLLAAMSTGSTGASADTREDFSYEEFAAVAERSDVLVALTVRGAVLSLLGRLTQSTPSPPPTTTTPQEEDAQTPREEERQPEPTATPAKEAEKGTESSQGAKEGKDASKPRSRKGKSGKGSHGHHKHRLSMNISASVLTPQPQERTPVPLAQTGEEAEKPKSSQPPPEVPKKPHGSPIPTIAASSSEAATDTLALSSSTASSAKGSVRRLKAEETETVQKQQSTSSLVSEGLEAGHITEDFSDSDEERHKPISFTIS
jgi:hypothetical protein